MSSKPTRVVIADDHTILREGLHLLLDLEPDFEVVAEAADGAEAVTMVNLHQPAILLLDLAMPNMSGLDVLRQLAQQDSATRSILLTGAIERHQIIEALRLGARGVVMKESAAQLLIKAMRTVIAGLYWIGREPVTNLTAFLREENSSRRPSRARTSFGLTRRETDILGTIVGGLSNKEIAQKLSLSEDTVKHHLTNIFDKVEVTSRLELALFAINNGLIES